MFKFTASELVGVYTCVGIIAVCLSYLSLAIVTHDNTYNIQCVTDTQTGIMEVFRAENSHFVDGRIVGTTPEGDHFEYTIPAHVLCRGVR